VRPYDIHRRIGTVSDAGRSYRLPALIWIEGVAKALPTRESLRGGWSRENVVALNNLALLNFLAGDYVKAREVCQVHLELADGNPSIGFQALVNLGRIMRAEARSAESVAHFRGMLDALSSEVRVLDSPNVSLLDKELHARAESILVVEWIKSLLSADMYGEAMSALNNRAVQVASGGAVVLLLELRIAFSLDREMLSDVGAMLRDEVWMQERHTVLVRQLYLSFALDALGCRRSSVKAIDGIGSAARLPSPSGDIDHRDLRLLASALGHALRLGDDRSIKELGGLVDIYLSHTLDIGVCLFLQAAGKERLPQLLANRIEEALEAEARSASMATAALERVNDYVSDLGL